MVWNENTLIPQCMPRCTVQTFNNSKAADLGSTEQPKNLLKEGITGI